MRPLFLTLFLLFLVLAFSSSSHASKDYYLASPEQIARVIDSGKGEGRKAIFIYASWCAYCRAALPYIIEIEKEKKGSVIAISIDKDPDTFARYISTRHGKVPFVPIVWNQKGDLYSALERFGIQPAKGIPFTALLDEYGYVYKQGVIRPADTKSYVLKENKVKATEGL